MTPDGIVAGNKNELLDHLLTDAMPGSIVHEAQKTAVIVRCTEDLEAAIGALRKSANANVVAVRS